MRHLALLNIAQNTIVVIASILLVSWFSQGMMGAILGLVIPTIAISALSPILIRDTITFGKSMWDKLAVRATTVFGFYIVLSSSIGFLNAQIGNILIGYYLNPSEVGIYAVAVMLAQVLTLIPSAVQQVTAPMTATLYSKRDIQGVRHLFHSTLKKSLIISLIIALAIAIAAPAIITIIFTEAYASSYVPLLILLVGYAIGASYGAVGATLSSIGKVKTIFRISGICAIFNIILTILLVPVIGINGAALATTATMIANFLITVGVVRSYLGK
jgi:stage V sporulation protein B